jgi:hypothetical protein
MNGDVERILKLQMSERVIALRPHDIRILGGMPEAAFMQQMCFHCRANPDDWFYHTATQIEEETTLSVDQQQRVRKKLVGLGVLAEERRGTPAKMYYRVNWTRLVELLYPEMPNQESENLPILIRRNTQTNKSDVVESNPSDYYAKPDLPKLDSRPQHLWEWYCGRVNMTVIPIDGKNMTAAKELIRQGFTTPKGMNDLFAWLLTIPFWANQGIDLTIMAAQATKYRAAVATKKIQYAPYLPPGVKDV